MQEFANSQEQNYEHNQRPALLTEKIPRLRHTAPLERILKGLKTEERDFIKVRSNELWIKERNCIESQKNVITRFPIHRWKNLKIFKINYEDFVEGMEEKLITAITRHYQTLQTLGLSVSESNLLNYNDMDNKDVERICSFIGWNLTCLKDLTLDLRCQSRISSEGLIKGFSHIAKNIINLQRLELNFQDCLQINDDCFKQLASLIGRYLVRLRSLSLDIRWCDKISNQGLESFLVQTSRHLTHLSHLSLKLENSLHNARLDSDGIFVILPHTLKIFVNLKVLSLNINRPSVINDRYLRTLKIRLKKHINPSQKVFLNNQEIIQENHPRMSSNSGVP